MAQTWDLQVLARQTWYLAVLITANDAAGIGNNTSQGVGNVTASLYQYWPIALLDTSTATGIGNNVSQGVGVVSASNYAWYSVDVLVLYSDVLIYTSTKVPTTVAIAKRAVPASVTSTVDPAATVVAPAPRAGIVTVEPDFSVRVQTFVAH